MYDKLSCSKQCITLHACEEKLMDGFLLKVRGGVGAGGGGIHSYIHKKEMPIFIFELCYFVVQSLTWLPLAPLLIIF